MKINNFNETEKQQREISYHRDYDQNVDLAHRRINDFFDKIKYHYDLNGMDMYISKGEGQSYVGYSHTPPLEYPYGKTACLILCNQSCYNFKDELKIGFFKIRSLTDKINERYKEIGDSHGRNRKNNSQVNG